MNRTNFGKKLRKLYSDVKFIKEKKEV